jgi:hypothetical protein
MATLSVTCATTRATEAASSHRGRSGGHALHTRRSTPPCRALTPATSAATSSVRVASERQGSKRPPVSAMAAARASLSFALWR